MTTIAEGLRTLILADTTVSGLIGARMYPVILPQAAVMPALTYQYITGDSVLSNDGPTGLEHPFFQVDAWGETYASMNALFEAVRILLNGFQGDAGGVSVQGIFLARKRDLYDDQGKLYRRVADYGIWNEEST